MEVTLTIVSIRRSQKSLAVVLIGLLIMASSTVTLAILSLGFPVSSFVSLTPMSYRIRPAQFDDLQALADVLARSFYPPLGWKRWLYPVMRFSIYEDLKQRLQGAQRYYTCLAAIECSSPLKVNSVVGTVEMSCRRYSWRAFSQPQQVYLSNLAVCEGYRRRGVARELLKTAEAQALDWGFRAIYLHVMADNHRARHLYEQMGYQVQQVETNLFSLVNMQPQRLLLKKTLTASQNLGSVSSKSPQRSMS